MKSVLLLAAAAALVPLAAGAATVTLSNIVAGWSDALPDAVFDGVGTTNATARWGVDNGFGQSGYNFVSAGTASVVVPPSPSPRFSLGTFTHVNQPVLPPSISAIRLTVTADIDVDGNAFGSRSFVFDFAHDETPNGTDPCLFGGANRQGANIEGCADRVQVSFNPLSDTFQISGVTYTVSVSGFLVGTSLVSDFLSPERSNNAADLVARVTTLRDITEVPVPGALALFGAGLFGLLAARRRG